MVAHINYGILCIQGISDELCTFQGIHVEGSHSGLKKIPFETLENNF